MNNAAALNVVTDAAVRDNFYVIASDQFAAVKVGKLLHHGRIPNLYRVARDVLVAYQAVPLPMQGNYHCYLVEYEDGAYRASRLG